ncbi:hypothetical protein KIN20_035042 [Parelaphostrongylus tenuis]|uniref:Uncharacterized protein n=1 Tax=Parelaphostrongylus tenuis TaxID=148309 RepID=A0AAD5WK51_PARTN|nr:hypothetical protein KIN20_035042 [Parelaphostrongylus tenuis]
MAPGSEAIFERLQVLGICRTPLESDLMKKHTTDHEDRHLLCTYNVRALSSDADFTLSEAASRMKFYVSDVHETGNQGERHM